MSAQPEKKSGGFSPKALFDKATRFFRDQKSEMKKVVWPSKKQIKNNTAIVIGAVVVSAVIVGGFDMILSTIVKIVFRA